MEPDLVENTSSGTSISIDQFQHLQPATVTSFEDASKVDRSNFVPCLVESFRLSIGQKWLSL